MPYNEIADKIISLINQNYLKYSSVELTNASTSTYDSLVVSSPENAYRKSINKALLCRIKSSGKQHYVAFNSAYKKLFDESGIETHSIKSDLTFFRMSPDVFIGMETDDEVLSSIVNKVFVSLFSFNKFDCCDRFEQCSNADKCLHDDLIYSTACTYRDKLEHGINYWSKRV